MNRADYRLLAALCFLAVAVALWMMFPIADQKAEQSPALPAVDRYPLLQAESGSTEPTPNRVVVPQLDFETHAQQLQQKYGDEFTVVIEKPFVVIGDGPAKNVKRWATGTIRWAVAQVKNEYFKNDPDHIINIWLFKDKESYEANTKKLFGSVPSTPYGYYSPSDKVLVMNISTGGGTLVHEIVHPFMAANFEACPSWFNEGLASLYEQSSEKDGRIVGLTNWRLRGLQLAIKDGLLGSFERIDVDERS